MSSQGFCEVVMSQLNTQALSRAPGSAVLRRAGTDQSEETDEQFIEQICPKIRKKMYIYLNMSILWDL